MPTAAILVERAAAILCEGRDCRLRAWVRVSEGFLRWIIVRLLFSYVEAVD